jgi:hypothetical protein
MAGGLIMLKRLALIFGALFVLVGLLGFVSNPLVGPGGYFMTNGPHNLTHLLIGAVLIFAGTQTERAAWISLMTFGAVYLLLAVMGYSAVGAEGHANLLGMVHINGNDNWLHLVVGVVLIVSALGARSSSHAHVH